MKKHILTAAAAVLLVACGGGGGGGDDGPSSSTKVQPTANDLSVVVGGLNGTVVVSDSLGHNYSTSSSGTYKLSSLDVGTAYSVSVSQQPADQVCSVSQGSGVLRAPKAVEVNCVDGVTLALGADYAVAQLALVEVPSSTVAVTATLGGAAVDVHNEQGSFAFLVPDMAAGTYRLQVTVDGRTFSREMNVRANPLAEPATQYLSRRANAVLADIQNQLAGTTLSADERVLLEQVRTTLQAELPKLSSLPAGEALQAARILAANEVATIVQAVEASAQASPGGTRVSAMGARTSPMAVTALAWSPSAACTAARKKYLVGIASAGVGFGILLFGGPVSSVFAATVLGGMIGSGLQDFSAGRRGMALECQKPKKVTIFEELDDIDVNSATGLSKTRLAIGKPLATADSSVQQFTHDVAVTVTPSVLFELDRSVVSDSVLSRGRGLASSYAALNGKFDALALPPLVMFSQADLKREETKPADTSKLSVVSTRSDITASATPDGNKLVLKFKFANTPYPETTQSFSFKLVNTEMEVSSDMEAALLAPPQGPKVAHLTARMYEGGTLRGKLPTADANRYNIVEAAKHGTVTLVNAVTGEFRYAPQPGYVGQDTFTYTVTKDNGTSAPATSAPATGIIYVAPECIAGQSAGRNSISCNATLPMQLAYTSAGTYASELSPVLGNFALSSVGDYSKYAENSYDYAGGSAQAPSGHAVAIRADTGVYDAQSDAFTQLMSDGTFDSASDAPVGRTSVTRRRSTLVKHRDGKSYITGSGTYAYAWLENNVGGGAYVSFYIIIEAHHAGYAVDGKPLYAGTRTDCMATDTAAMRIQVTTLGPNGETSYAPEYLGACPLTVDTFSSLAPAVTPSNARLDWRTGATR